MSGCPLWASLVPCAVAHTGVGVSERAGADGGRVARGPWSDRCPAPVHGRMLSGEQSPWHLCWLLDPFCHPPCSQDVTPLLLQSRRLRAGAVRSPQSHSQTGGEAGFQFRFEGFGTHTLHGHTSSRIWGTKMFPCRTPTEGEPGISFLFECSKRSSCERHCAGAKGPACLPPPPTRAARQSGCDRDRCLIFVGNEQARPWTVATSQALDAAWRVARGPVMLAVSFLVAALCALRRLHGYLGQRLKW